MSRLKLRQIMGFLLAVVGLVGLLRNVGIVVPGLSKVVFAFFKMPFLFVSKWLVLPSTFGVYFAMLQNQLLWCLSATWMGIAAWLWGSRDASTDSVWKIIIYCYGLLAIAISSGVFVLCFAWDPLMKVKFYAASLSLGLLAGFLSGRIVTFAQELPRKNL